MGGGGGFLSTTNPRHDKWIVSVYSVEKSSKHQRDEPQQTDNEMKVKEWKLLEMVPHLDGSEKKNKNMQQETKRNGGPST